MGKEKMKKKTKKNKEQKLNWFFSSRKFRFLLKDIGNRSFMEHESFSLPTTKCYNDMLTLRQT
jgi:hypothetical protein